MSRLYPIAKPFLFAMDAETAHRATIAALRMLPQPRPMSVPGLAIEAFGLKFPNPLGLAAGFDKGGEVTDALFALGFGFVEIGTVTPRPQPGNPRPRLFRLREDEAVINRFGFNSEGHAPVHARLAARTNRSGVLGVNIGANKDSIDRSADYVAGIRAFADVTSYFAINVSSPNTPGLRDLQQAAVLDELLARALEARDEAALDGPHVPLLLKIAPDLGLAELDDIVRVARDRRIDGMIVSNTTIARPESLRSREARESGGLSGRPLFAASTRMLAETFRRVEGQFPLVGVGGIDGPEAAFAKIEAGATLVQLYSALAFRGPGLVAEILEGLSRRLGGRPLTDVVGTRAAEACAA